VDSYVTRKRYEARIFAIAALEVENEAYKAAKHPEVSADTMLGDLGVNL